MIYTIGHSKHKVEEFVQLLIDNGIDCICDIRSLPYSKFAEQYNRENLTEILKKYNIQYLFFGEEFGARPKEKKLLTNGCVDFEKVSKGEVFQKGIDRIKNGLNKNYKIALMCTEKDPIDCHRTILVSRSLNQIGIEIRHILPDGTIKTHKEIETELINKYFTSINQMSMFDNYGYTDYLAEAYKKANLEIGYREDSDD